jgi:hypothetical protein
MVEPEAGGDKDVLVIIQLLESGQGQRIPAA